MRLFHLRILVLLSLPLGLAAVFGGCSGAGITSRQFTDSPVQTLSADHMTTVQFVRSWLKIQYPKPHVPGPYTPEDYSETLGDGTLHVWGTDTYGRPYDRLYRRDSSGSGTWYIGEMPVTASWGPRVQHSKWVASQHQVFEFPGMTLDYTSTTTFPPGGGPAAFRRVGTQTLADGRALALDFNNDGVGEEQMHLIFAEDDVDLEFVVPVTTVPGRSWQPLPVSSVVGNTQTKPGAVTFTLTGTNGVWERWEFTGPEDMTGAFVLTEDMAGRGQVRQAGKLAGVLAWDRALIAHLELTDIGQVEISPSGAARDFAIDRWVRNWAGLGPTPTP